MLDTGKLPVVNTFSPGLGKEEKWGLESVMPTEWSVGGGILT